MLKRLHDMPFGARQDAAGRVRFRLWAPGANQVALCLEGTEHDELPMAALEAGWFELSTDRAGIGSRYRFRIDGDTIVPDPASRFQPQDVHGPSEVIDPGAWHWQDGDWRGRPWEEAVIYELHVGAFTAQGTFAAAQAKLDHLVQLGVTAVELMPVADFPGKRNWGYDGVYPFAPDAQYGRPEDLKALVDAAHRRGLMVFLDVVYNHFGPEGNYLHVYAPAFFTERHMTPWGAAINFDDRGSHWVREFFIHNALYWLEEYHLDGLRFDAVHAIVDDSQPDILVELAERVGSHFAGQRHIHLVLENDHNSARYLTREHGAKPRWYAAQWNDDIHHALHVALTGESIGYYQDYGDDPIRHLGRCLSEGFAYQGERSAYREGSPRGERSDHLPPTAFVSFLQNHDQIGNRAFGERITRLASPEQVQTVMAIVLLAPSPPLLFMGEEWGCVQPFAFFCDFGPDLAEQVVAGRRREFAQFPQFSDPQARERIPDPMDPLTFERSVLDWNDLNLPQHKQWLGLYRSLLDLRHRELVPRLRNPGESQAFCTQLSERALSVHWVLGDNAELYLVANLGDEPVGPVSPRLEPVLYTTHPESFERHKAERLPPWSVTWYLLPKGTDT